MDWRWAILTPRSFNPVTPSCLNNFLRTASRFPTTCSLSLESPRGLGPPNHGCLGPGPSYSRSQPPALSHSSHPCLLSPSVLLPCFIVFIATVSLWNNLVCFCGLFFLTFLTKVWSPERQEPHLARSLLPPRCRESTHYATGPKYLWMILLINGVAVGKSLSTIFRNENLCAPG